MILSELCEILTHKPYRNAWIDSSFSEKSLNTRLFQEIKFSILLWIMKIKD